MLLKHCILVISLLAGVHLQSMGNNYGAYTLSVDSFDVCRGPKTRNLSEITASFKETTVEINFTALTDVKIDEFKISVMSMKGNKVEPSYNYKLPEPCKHYVLAQILKQQLKAEKCIVKKGIYITRVNVGDIVESFFGTSFFYGRYMFKAYVLSKLGNIGCYIAVIVFKKK